jgi:hypothetical protein
VSFDVGVGGGCPTCAYTFNEAVLSLRCSCGARSKVYSVDFEVVGGLSAMFAELSALAVELGVDPRQAADAVDDASQELGALDERRGEIEVDIDESRRVYFDFLG